MEKTTKPVSGYLMLFVELIVLAATIFIFVAFRNPLGLIGVVTFLILLPGFFFVNPNSSRVLILFGEYKGTVKDNGFFYVNPFYVKKSISLRARNFDSERVKVNDKVGNPILIGVILVWKVNNTFKAAFEVDGEAGFLEEVPH